ncbi:hypothetical protein AB1L30_05320 [Bremerella sp. JC817]|uniref:hypothetical protein n=1 Tax=Bremerella sp. JC817 TaxID=3231756 RepID=UPI003457A6FA
MTRLTQVFLKPGWYKIGNRMQEFTANDLDLLVERTATMLSAGIRIPLWGAHKSPGSLDGGPQPEENSAVDNLGWMIGVRQLEDGSLEQTLEVLDDEAATAIESGRVQFTSPEIGPYTDGLGREFGVVIRHMALTATPRNPEQGAFQPVLQFSLDDQLHPRSTTTKLIEALAARGVLLDEQWTNTAAGLEQLLEAIEANLPLPTESEPSETTETTDDTASSLQFSEPAQAAIDAQMQQVARLQAQLDQQHRTQLTRRFAGLPLPLREFCQRKAESVQFSETGSDAPNVSLTEVADLFRQVLPGSMQLPDNDLRELSPSAELLGEEPDPQNDQLTDAVLRSIGIGR